MGGAAERIMGPWSPEEDELLQRLVDRHGPRNWSVISKPIPRRSGKSCRLRWCNQLSPGEDETIIRAHARVGNKWATIVSPADGQRHQEPVELHPQAEVSLHAAFDPHQPFKRSASVGPTRTSALPFSSPVFARTDPVTSLTLSLSGADPVLSSLFKHPTEIIAPPEIAPFFIGDFLEAIMKMVKKEVRN